MFTYPPFRVYMLSSFKANNYANYKNAQLLHHDIVTTINLFLITLPSLQIKQKIIECVGNESEEDVFG